MLEMRKMQGQPYLGVKRALRTPDMYDHNHVLQCDTYVQTWSLNIF